MRTAFEQLQQIALALERLEQFAQAIHIGPLVLAHQIGLASDQHVAAGAALERGLRDLHRGREQLVQARALLLHFA